MKHRSELETKLWLKTRLWFKKYKANLCYTFDGNEDMITPFINGEMGPSTISAAFYYKDTPEGVEYWGKREERFLRWYYYQGKEIFRCKWFTIQI